jgi:hypothetical protein
MTELSNFIGGIIKRNSNARNRVLADWAKFGGRTAAIDAVKEAWKSLMSVVDPIRDAFRDIFPATTGKQLADLTRSIDHFFERFRVGESTGEDLQRTFRGLFAVLDIGFQIIGGIFHLLGSLFGVMSDGSGGVLNFTGNIGDMLVAFDNWLKKTDAITTFFTVLGSVLAVPIQLIGDLASAIAGLFSGGNSGGLDATGESIGRLSERLSPLQGLLDGVVAAWQRFTDFISAGVKLFAPLVEGIASLFGGLGQTIADSMSTGDFDPVLDMINTGLLGAITLLFAKFVKNGINFNLFGADSGVFGSIAGSLDALTGSLEAMQANIQADTLLKIGGAVALITASVVALSLIDSKALTKSLTALSIGFGQLLGAMAILVKISGSAGLVKVPTIAAAMVLLAGSILILSGAVAILAQLSWEELSKGLLGVGALLLGIAGFTQIIGRSAGTMLAVGLAMIPLATGINILVGAVALMGSLNWGTIGKGLVGIAGALLVIAGAMQLMPITLPVTAAGLVLVSIALSGIAAAMKLFATMKWSEMGKGMVGIAGGLLIIAGAMSLMPATLPLTAAGLLLLAPALMGIAAVAKVFATMSWAEMGKAAVALAGALLIIAGGMQLMQGALLGAAALLVVSAALAVLAPVLVTLGAMSWEMIGKGLATLAAVFVLLGAAGLLLAPLVPVILALSAAILILGAGMALAGAGMLAFGIGLAALAGAGGAGIAIFKQAIIEMVTLLPELAKAMALALVDMVTAIADHSADMVKAFAKLMGALLDGAIKLVPKFGKLIAVLVDTGINILQKKQDAMIAAGLDLIIALLRGIEKKMPEMTDAAGDAAAAFIRGMGKQSGKLANAGLDALVDFLNGLADAIDSHQGELNNAGARVAKAIIDAILAPFAGLGGEILSALNSAAQHAASSFHFPHISIGNPFNRGAGRVDVIGQYVEELGLVGGSEQIKEGFDHIREGLANEIEKTNKIIERDKDKLEKLKDKGQGDSKEARKLAKEIKEQQERRKDLTNEQDKWNKKMKDERSNLLGLGKQYDALQAKIEEANKTLEDAQKARDDFVNSTQAQFSQKPDIQAGMSLGNYMRQVQKKTEQTKKFMETLMALRAAGLSDESYRQLLAEGVDAQKLMEQMLAGGSEAVQQFNAANAALQAAAGTLASQASTQLYYDAAVASAQATLQGWQDQEAPLEAQMTRIARIMVKAIKKALGIKSPSRVFREIADYTTEGFTGGLEAGIGAVEKSTEKMGIASLETMKATMSSAGSDIFDFTPTIAPVLDLTQLAKDASQIGTMLATEPLVANVSYEKASGIAADQQAAAAAAASATPTEFPEIKFEQTINSPETVDDVTVYRGTKSLLSIAKEALSGS